MKRVVILTLLGLTLGALSANSAVITNVCTSTYQLIGLPEEVLSNSDAVSVNLSSEPVIFVSKSAKNLRTGMEDNDLIYALMGDTIEFTIDWSNSGGSTANTVTLTDYIPAGMTYVAGSLTSSETNCLSGSANESSGKITYVGFDAAGTNPGPYGYGRIKFRVKID